MYLFHVIITKMTQAVVDNTTLLRCWGAKEHEKDWFWLNVGNQSEPSDDLLA